KRSKDAGIFLGQPSRAAAWLKVHAPRSRVGPKDFMPRTSTTGPPKQPKISIRSQAGLPSLAPSLVAEALSPRRIRRGPVEASLITTNLNDHAASPRRIRRGPVEAFQLAHPETQTIRSPRRIRRGPVEA